jgi:menaquinol-cytochrome c reductase iron-sulfur subunit
VGGVDTFQIGETVQVSFENADPLPWDGPAARSSAWLRREGPTQFLAFSINCTHLGCPVRWEKGAELFLCPCHGGVYYKDGSVAAGPPPHSLIQYPVRVNNGDVQIETSQIPLV